MDLIFPGHEFYVLPNDFVNIGIHALFRYQRTIDEQFYCFSIRLNSREVCWTVRDLILSNFIRYAGDFHLIQLIHLVSSVVQ